MSSDHHYKEYNLWHVCKFGVTKLRLPSPLKNLSSELKRRKVYPVIAGYGFVAWILLQIGEVTFEPLGLPPWAMTLLVIVVIGGFPIALILSWVFDITATGLQRDSAITQDKTPSIAVLPFADMSPNKDQGYFCEGVAEEILNALTKIDGLQVASRTSSFQYGDGQGDIREIGHALGVRAVLEGSVRKSRNRLRVTAQLIKAADGYHLWSKSFDQELEDIFAIQDEIATCIAESLLDAMTKVKTTSSQDVRAYEYYLRGRQFFNRFRKKDIEFARQMFRQAIDIDPEFALAWAGYADCFSFLVMYVEVKENYCSEAGAASKRALELGPELAEAHASRGLAYLISEQFEPAEMEFETAIKLNPKLFEAYYYFGRTRFHQGRLQEAADLFAKAAEVNPQDYQSRLLRVQILHGLGQLDAAAAEAKEGVAAVENHLALNPDDARALHLGAGSLVLLGEFERAENWLNKALEIDPQDSVVLYNVACNQANMGNTDTALKYLEQAVEYGTVSVAWMRNDEDLASLRGHPRYESLLQNLESQSNRGN